MAREPDQSGGGRHPRSAALPFGELLVVAKTRMCGTVGADEHVRLGRGALRGHRGAAHARARVVIEHAAPTAGERVIDVGCGTGNAALLAAERGAGVTGVDPAARLLEVASQRAAARGLEAQFVRGEAEALPIGDGDADLVLSVFGVIFASDPRTAAAEMARVTAPEGRIVLSAWHPSGAVHRAVGAASEAVRQAHRAPSGPSPFPWHETRALAELFGPHGFRVSVADESIAFKASSPQAYVDQQADHPLAVAGQAGPRSTRRERSPARTDGRDLRSRQRGPQCLPRDLSLHRGERSPAEVTPQQALREWRDPDSNRGHHDFQSSTKSLSRSRNPCKSTGSREPSTQARCSQIAFVSR